MKEKLKLLLEIFITFFKIGSFTFGGGYAMIPLISKETVEQKKWVTKDDILEIVAIAESTPGPIAINAATFVGFRTGGFLGALVATLGVVVPSFVIILAISGILNVFKDIHAVKYAFIGIRAGVLALILKGLISMYKQCPKSILSYIIFAASFVLVAFFKINVLFVIMFCATIGIISSLVARRKIK